MLNGLIVAALGYVEEISFDKSLLEVLNKYRETLFNPLSHYSNHFQEVFKCDLEKLFTLSNDFDLVKNFPILKVNEMIIFDVKTEEGVII